MLRFRLLAEPCSRKTDECSEKIHDLIRDGVTLGPQSNNVANSNLQQVIKSRIQTYRRVLLLNYLKIHRCKEDEAEAVYVPFFIPEVEICYH